MLSEYLKFLTAKASSHARELGYLKESIALEARAHRYWSFWNTHFEHCRKLILAQTQGLKKGTEIWIAGSGYLFETPWQDLIDRGFHLHLIDVYQPARIRRLAAKNPSLQLHELDLTGFMDLSPLHKALLKVPSPPNFEIKKNDFLISSNLWSQLHISPIQFLCENTEVNEKEKVEWARSIQKLHEDWLLSFGVKGLIFSDFESHISKKNELTIEIQPQRPERCHFVTSWDWRWDENTIRKVEAYSF